MRLEEAEQQAIRQFLSRPAPSFNACGCMGPKGNQPVCPCAMQWVEIVEGAYYGIEEIRQPSGISHVATFMCFVKNA